MKTRTQSNGTLHQQILVDIEKRIVSGDWPPGYRLPFEVDLAKSYNVSRMTVNKVLTKLADAGLIERRRKSGSFVSQPQVQSAILEIHDIEAEVVSLKQEYSFRMLENATRKSSRVDAELFGLVKKASIQEVSCVHDAGGAPFCWEYRLINLDVVPEAQSADFDSVSPGKWLRLQVPWTTAQHKIYAVAADARIAGHLDIEKGSPCLVVQRRTWCDQGAVTFARIVYPAEKHAIVAAFTPASTTHAT
ncbi:MAG: histidine utilization repressor [Kaistia sp. SCN 65-12]|nr:MAG: histidine utilization repressor [Kaistia sp. SCN 65-12]